MRPRPRHILKQNFKQDQYQDWSWFENSVKTETNTWSWQPKSWILRPRARVLLNSAPLPPVGFRPKFILDSCLKQKIFLFFWTRNLWPEIYLSTQSYFGALLFFTPHSFWTKFYFTSFFLPRLFFSIHLFVTKSYFWKKMPKIHFLPKIPF